jgi:hypothetical protein
MSACSPRRLLRFPTARRQLDADAALTCLAPHLVGRLVEPAAFGALRRLASSLPAVWRWAMLECRLGFADSRVDFMACVADVHDDRSLLNAALQRSRPDSFAGATSLLEAWAAGGALLSAVPIVWLEWDVVNGVPARPLSSVCLDRTFLRPRAEPVDRPLQAQLVHHLLADVMGEAALAARVSAGLATCLRELPDDACLLHAAPLLARGLDRLRLTLGLRPDQMLRWLDAIGWPGDLRAVAAWLEVMSAPWQRVFFQVELDHEMHPHLSVETRLSSAGFMERAKWRQLLEVSANADLVDPVRGDLVLSWPGESTLVTSEEAIAFERAAYLKIVLNAGRASEVKAYLGCFRAL